jgi:hypothetical protein
MKRLMMTVAALALLMTPAHAADRMPSQFVGYWCGNAIDAGFIPLPRRRG